jgi:hypothetical protein
MIFRRIGVGSVHQVNLSLATVYLMSAWLAYDFRDPVVVPYAIGLNLCLAAFAWFSNLRRYRVITDHPTSRVASAPQGYIELDGQASDADGFGLIAPLSSLPCVWYRYELERREGDKWVASDSGVSRETLLLVDGSGKCLVDPDGAEVHTRHYRMWIDGQSRKKEWLIQAGDKLYVIGDHVTLGGANSDLDYRADLATLLNEWKQDKADLLHRFDADRNGEIDMQEWEQARLAAERQVARDHLDIRTRDGFHLLRKPGHRRLFLIANQPPATLARNYRLWSWFHLAVLLGGSLAGIALAG